MLRTWPDLRAVHQIPVLLAVPVPRLRSYGSRPRPLPHPRCRRRLRITPELILALLILPCHDEPYCFCVTGSNAVSLSIVSRTRLSPSTYPIPTSTSSLRADRTPSYTYRSTPDTFHLATRLTHRPMPQEGYGSMMASCPARSTIRSPSPPSALPAQTRVAQSPVSQSATTTAPPSSVTSTSAAPRASMAHPSASAMQARYGLMCP